MGTPSDFAPRNCGQLTASSACAAEPSIVRPVATSMRQIAIRDKMRFMEPVLNGMEKGHDEAAQAREVCARVLDAHEDGTALRDQAVLVRAAHHSDILEIELSARKIPYVKFGGLRFTDTAHVKDFLAAANYPTTARPHLSCSEYRPPRSNRSSRSASRGP